MVLQAHAVCSAVAETRALLDQKIEENRVALIEARDKLDSLQMSREENNGREDKSTDQDGLEIMGTINDLLLVEKATESKRTHSHFAFIDFVV